MCSVASYSSAYSSCERQGIRLIAVPISFRTYDAVFRADLAYLDRLEVNWFRYNSLFASVPTD
ncbi:MAG: hypothetical protein NPIRA01_32420 [Nitrospirales bacterium]|nr:MAG: hypothetical protein NPIRA01_32420 [Nitrospirales bacterium]